MRKGGGGYLAPDSLRLRLYSSNSIKQSHCSIQNTQSTLHLKAVLAFTTLTPFHATNECKVFEIVYSTAEHASDSRYTTAKAFMEQKFLWSKSFYGEVK